MVENKTHGFPLLPSFLSALDLSLTHVKGKIPFHSLCHSGTGEPLITWLDISL